MSRRRVLILTGLSGSGKSSAARALEDEGFFVVDNLPLALLPRFLELADAGGRLAPDIAVVIDVRNREFLAGIEKILQELQGAGHLLEIYFFEATDEALIRRFSETRRRHPLACREGVPEAIARERQLLQNLKSLATVVVDSTGLTPHQLRAKVIGMVRGEQGGTPLFVRLQSFGFRYGIPLESDLVMDVRFLANPHFDVQLRPMTGLNRAVREFVLNQPACRDFVDQFQNLLKFLLPHYKKEGKSYLTVSIGCTGGRHRSVAIVEELRPFFSGEGVTLDIIHRDLDKG